MSPKTSCRGIELDRESSVGVVSLGGSRETKKPQHESPGIVELLMPDAPILLCCPGGCSSRDDARVPTIGCFQSVVVLHVGVEASCSQVCLLR